MMGVAFNTSLIRSVTGWLFLLMEVLPNPVFSQPASVSAKGMELSDSDADRYGFINVDGRFEESEALLLGLLQNTTRFHDGVI